MSKRRRFDVELLELGFITAELHYGIFARDWWVKRIVNDSEFLIPFRQHMRVKCFLNSKNFEIAIYSFSKNPYKPGFQCFCNNYLSPIEDSPSKALNSLYHKIFNTNTEYSGLYLHAKLFWGPEIAISGKKIYSLIEDTHNWILFLFPYIEWILHKSQKVEIPQKSKINFGNIIEQFLTIVSRIGHSKKEENHYKAGSGYISSIVTRYKGQNHLFLLKIQKNECQIEVYHEETHIKTFNGATPDIVWNEIGIHKKLLGSYIFGITHEQVQKQLQNSKSEEFLLCTSDKWDNQELMNEIFARHIKSRKIPNTMNNWQELFLNWKLQRSSIIIFSKILESIYPINYQFQDKELSAWRAMFRSCGCTDVTPYHRKLSKIEFWSNAQDPQSDQNTLSYLHHSDMLQIEPGNKRGAEGCIRILSIIAEGFSISKLKKNLSIGSDTITNARKHARLYGPGVPPFEKPKRIVHKMSKIKEQQFLWFFQDRANIAQSSYKVDSKSNLPICYLCDQKSELWKKFEETYPNGMKKTSFMVRLANTTYLKYREDLGALCQICNDYGFEPFENLESIVREEIPEKKNQDIILTRIDQLKRHMRRGYEEKLKINSNGTIIHDSCVSHCLLYAFGDCDQIHQTRCNNCDQFFQLFNWLTNQISNSKIQKLEEIQEKLKYYLSHQTRKVYLNAQFKPMLNSLDNNGAVIICDYKMRVLPKSARETKSEFFGKRGWTLHSILIFTHNSEKNTELNISAYDHWSTDTKQDSWFTASSFEAVFNSLEKKPKWIRIISDNGPHYNWYQIEIRSWIFLEPGEAKTIIDSYHAAISHAIKRYIQVGYDITTGEDIVMAGKNLAGTHFANLQPNRENQSEEEQSDDAKELSRNSKKNITKKATIKIIKGISNLFYWEWPINNDKEGYICARTLPGIGKFINFSPSHIANLCNGNIARPQPTISTYTTPNTKWKMSIETIPESKENTINNKERQSIIFIDTDFPLNKGWALKGNQKLGNRGGGKRMTKKVKNLLESFFMNGNMNTKDKLDAQGMQNELSLFVESGEISKEDIPKVSTIQNWIATFSRAWKAQATKQYLY
ncbi:hypothetical protein Glove_351g19 [Diversispora epigaea]|uniref:Uncharacterized protein n=1 Tax=Diversispora epigaea TaxID=1348612 RepID=A0A397HHF1_9GLOM|nr:hypothetical protein Glove_351g19 [Diversispora epigaea]